MPSFSDPIVAISLAANGRRGITLFAPPWVDWAISWSKHPLMDTPVDCSHVEIKLDWAAHTPVAGYTKAELGLPPDAVILMSAGRHVKFQDPAFWRAIGTLLDRHSDAWFLVVGSGA